MHRKEMQQSEATSRAALATDYDFLLSEINRARQRIKDESQQLESNVQLDLSLERKRRTELLGEVESKGREAGRFLAGKAEEIDMELKTVGRHAMTAIFTLGATIILGFVGYKFLFNE